MRNNSPRVEIISDDEWEVVDETIKILVHNDPVMHKKYMAITGPDLVIIEGNKTEVERN